MNRIAVTATMMAAASLAWTAPAMAKVSVRQGLAVDGMPVVVTSQGEVYTIAAAAARAPARRLGRLPRRASPLVASGSEAWAVRTGRQRAASISLYRVDTKKDVMERLVPSSSSIDEPIDVDAIAGVDSRFVYLLPDGRYDRQNGEIQPGHIEDAPDLQVLRVLECGERVWYLARDRAPDASGVSRLWILHDSSGNERGLRVMAGSEDGPVDLVGDDRSLFLVFEAGRVLRFDSASLRLIEDLGPMLQAGRIGFFAADPLHYWVGTISEPGAGDDRVRHALWRIERDTLDGGLFQAGSLSEGFLPLGVTGDDIWFGSPEDPEANPVVAIKKGDGTSRSYGIRGCHARRWRSFGHGALNVGETTVLIAVGLPVIVVAVITSPLWAWAV